jgi:hypothetical protein
MAHSIWWLSGIIGLKQGWIVHIDNLRTQSESAQQPCGTLAGNDIHRDRRNRIATIREVFTIPRDLVEDLQVNIVLVRVKRFVEEST